MQQLVLLLMDKYNISSIEAESMLDRALFDYDVVNTVLEVCEKEVNSQ